MSTTRGEPWLAVVRGYREKSWMMVKGNKEQVLYGSRSTKHHTHQAMCGLKQKCWAGQCPGSCLDMQVWFPVVFGTALIKCSPWYATAVWSPIAGLVHQGWNTACWRRSCQLWERAPRWAYAQTKGYRGWGVCYSTSIKCRQWRMPLNSKIFFVCLQCNKRRNFHKGLTFEATLWERCW